MRHALALLLAVSVGAVAGCGDDDKPRSKAESEFLYGAGPQRHADVTLQDDVVLLEGGPSAVLSVTADGLTWTIDAKAAGASELAVGKVMFATARGVGRIVDVRPAGKNRAVTIAPVELTEVIKKGTFSGDAPMRQIVSYSNEGSLWTDVSEQPAPSGSPQLQVMRAPRRQPTPERVEQPRPVHGPPKAANAAGFKITPVCCEGGVGAHLAYDDGGIRLSGTIGMNMQQPSARFHLAIDGGKVSAAELEVKGGIGFTVEIAGASQVGTDRQVNKTFPIPMDFSVPVGLVLGIPFTLTANQWIIVKTAFSSKDGNIKAKGEYRFGGTLGFGYANGTFGPHLPQGIAFSHSLLDSIEGISVGVNGIVLAYSTRFYLGIGAFGFTAGLYFGLTVSAGATVGSALGIIHCRGATLTVNANYGVGYTMPQLAADVVNFFMRVFKAKPIERTGGIGSQASVFNKSQNEPAGCK